MITANYVTVLLIEVCYKCGIDCRTVLQMSHKNNKKKSGNLTSLWPVNSFLDLCFPKAYLHITEFSISRAGTTSPVGQVSTGPLFSPSALTADLGDYDAIA